MRAAVTGSAAAAGRRGVATERDVVTVSDFESAIRELDGESEHSNIMVYGDSGCGKTVLAGTCPNSLILACEPGYISAARTTLGVPVGKRLVREVRDSATALAAAEYLEAGGASKYQWVILEGATTLETKVRLGYAAEAFDQNPEKRTHRNLPDKPDYFNTQNFLRSFIARLVDLPVNVLVTAHAMRMDNDEGDRQVMPAFQKKDGELSNYVSGLMHVVGFMRPRMVAGAEGEPKRKVRRILFSEAVDPKSDTHYFAKDQFNRLPRVLDDTNMQEVMKIIESDEPAAAPPRRVTTGKKATARG